MDLKRLTARVAGHIEAIEVAKKAGMTWDELAALFGSIRLSPRYRLDNRAGLMGVAA